MPGVRKRENRENQFYNVGEQGRKTGITLEDKGVRDEFGMEPVSGIFSSPEKSPPKRSDDTVSQSEPMDIADSTIPDLTPGHMLRNGRPSLPPPRSRSPIKTSLGATPRRSLGPRAQSAQRSLTPTEQLEMDATVTRKLDFTQVETSLQETPASPASETRNGTRRRDIYRLSSSPIPDEITANEVSELMDSLAEDSFAGAIQGNAVDEDTIQEEINEITAGEVSLQESDQEEEQSEHSPEPVKQPTKRGRKRKSDAIETEEQSPVVPKKTRTTAKQTKATEKASKTAPAPAPKQRGRPPRARQSNATEEESSIVDETSIVEEPSAQPKARGRPKKQAVTVTEEPAKAPVPAKRKGRQPKAQASSEAEPSSAKDTGDEAVIKKPKAAAKPKGKPKASDKTDDAGKRKSGTLVDTFGKPITDSQEADLRSVTSTASRFKRGLSVFRQLGVEEVAKAHSRSGRHIIKPVDFWRNERAEYDHEGNLVYIAQNEELEEPTRAKRAGPKPKGRKKKLAAIEEDEEELEDWEKDPGTLEGPYRDYDAATGMSLDDQTEEVLAWAQNGIRPSQVPNGEFKFTKLNSVGDSGYYSWGFLEFEEDDIKRSKNSRRMHMVFHVVQGAAEVNVNDNLFTIHKGGVWQVPRGNQYSIRNVAKGRTRIFFSQAAEIIRDE